MSGDALSRLLAADHLPPVCLLCGSEPLLLLEAADAFRARAQTLGFNERQVMDVEARFDWNELHAAASAMSLFASQRLLELRLPTGKPGREGSDAIREYCENPPPDTLLLILAGDWSRQHEGAWSKAVAKVGVVHPVAGLRPGQLPNWIRDRLRGQGISATPDAVQALAERVEGNLLAAAQEVDKLALLLRRPDGSVDSAPIDVERMMALVADSARFDVFGMADAALSGDTARSLRMLRGLRAEGVAVPALLGPVSYALSSLAELAAVQEAGGNVARAMQQARIWESKQRVYREALGRASPRHWQRALADLGRVDRMSKGREFGDAWLGLERLLTAIAAPQAGIGP
ncbi:MAG: DNA polymerase III subunit delta [Lysobacteraceae bacterium]